MKGIMHILPLQSVFLFAFEIPLSSLVHRHLNKTSYMPHHIFQEKYCIYDTKFVQFFPLDIGLWLNTSQNTYLHFLLDLPHF